MCLPDNKNALYWRTRKHFENVKKNTSKIEACVQTMSINIAKRYVEQIENDIEPPSGKRWYLPIFAVTESRKGKVRLVLTHQRVIKISALMACCSRGLI